MPLARGRGVEGIVAGRGVVLILDAARRDGSVGPAGRSCGREGRALAVGATRGRATGRARIFWAGPAGARTIPNWSTSVEMPTRSGPSGFSGRRDCRPRATPCGADEVPGASVRTGCRWISTLAVKGGRNSSAGPGRSRARGGVPAGAAVRGLRETSRPGKVAVDGRGPRDVRCGRPPARVRARCLLRRHLRDLPLSGASVRASVEEQIEQDREEVEQQVP